VCRANASHAVSSRQLQGFRWRCNPQSSRKRRNDNSHTGLRRAVERAGGVRRNAMMQNPGATIAGPTFRRLFAQMKDAGHPDHNKAQDTRTSHINRSFKGDLGSQISMRGSRIHSAKTQMKEDKKKQHPQTSESYICTHCSTMVSPE
jgi:hypothetical protein